MPTALAHRNDPDTSHYAAETRNIEEHGQVKGAILTLVTEQPRAAFELTPAYFARRKDADWPLVKFDCIAKRLSELVNAGRVVDSGERVYTPFNRPATVWRIPEPDAA